MLAAAVQFKADRSDLARSRDRLLGLCANAAEQGADLIVCPEMAITGYLFADAADVANVAEPTRGPSFLALAKLARQHNCALVCGYPEVVENGSGRLFFNSAWVIGPDGELLANYRKRCLFSADETWASPGDTPYPQVSLSWGELTVGICMDLNDDQFTDFLRRQQVDVVAFCTNWLEEGLDLHAYWRYRLLGVKSAFVAANTYGVEGRRGHALTQFAGQSAIFDSRGRRLKVARATDDAVILAELKLRR